MSTDLANCRSVICLEKVFHQPSAQRVIMNTYDMRDTYINILSFSNLPEHACVDYNVGHVQLYFSHGTVLKHV